MVGRFLNCPFLKFEFKYFFDQTNLSMFNCEQLMKKFVNDIFLKKIKEKLIWSTQEKFGVDQFWFRSFQI